MNIINKYTAIKSLYPTIDFGYAYNTEDFTDGIQYWNSDQTQPTDLEISNEVTRLQAEYDSLEYSRSRKAEYNKLNQDEMRYDDLKNNTNTWELAIDAIKLEYPKETI